MADSDNDTPAVAATPTTKVATSPYTLTVKHAFADYQIGERITDAATVNAILAGETAAYVLKTSA